MSAAQRSLVVVLGMSVENALRFELAALEAGDFDLAASFADAAEQFSREAFAAARS